jgi:hypothetical protein
LALASAAAGAKGAPRDVDAFIRNVLHVAASRRAAADLNGDGRPEIFVYATSDCGSGGCDLTILSPRARGYRVVMRSSVTQLPVRLLATSSHGWRDVGVTIGGGGIRQAYMARLRFDGRRYPENPTVPPAQPMKHPSGRVLIAAPTLRR